MQAMAVELSRQVATQPDRDKRVAADARAAGAQEIEGRAWDRYKEKPTGEDAQERTIWEGVREIRREIEGT